MSQAAALYHLQQIELAISKSQQRLDEILTALQNDSAVAAARSVVEQAQKARSPLHARVRDLELEIQTTNQKAKATEQQLYSGSVKNPKVMQEMQEEIEALKNRGEQLEERLLEAMLELEEADEQHSAAEKSLTEVMAVWETEHADLLAEQSSLQAQTAELEAQRETAVKAINPQSLKAYTTLKPRRGGQPVALLQGNTCAACGVEQTTTMVQEVRRDEKLITCSNCGRILATKA